MLEKNIPEIRFKGFEGEWEHALLGDLVNVFDGSHQTPNYQKNGVMFLSVEDIDTLKSEKYISVEDFKKNYKVYPEKGDVLMTRIGDVGTLNVYTSPQKVAFYVSLALLKPKDIDSYFLYSLLGSPLSQKELQNKTLITAIPKKINIGDISKINVYLTILKKEQNQIGKLFKNLDERLELEKDKLQKLKKLKKSMLESMFPKDGEIVPKIRFDGFEDEWEKDILGNHCDISTGKLDANAMVKGGKYMFYTSGIKTYKINSYSFQGPAITIAGNGATVGYMHLADGFFDAYQRTYVLTNIKIDRIFAFYVIKNNLFNKIKEESRAGSIPYIVMDMLTKLEITFPTIEEQKQIGNFFINLDKKIEVTEDRINKIEDFKESLMEKMFV